MRHVIVRNQYNFLLKRVTWIAFAAEFFYNIKKMSLPFSNGQALISGGFYSELQNLIDT